MRHVTMHRHLFRWCRCWWMVNVLCTISVNRLFSQTMCKIELRNYILNNVICVLHIVPKQKGAFCQRCTQQLQFACICFLIRYEHKQRLEEQRMWETMAERKKRRKRWLKLEGKWTPHNFYIVCMFTLRYATIAFACALSLSLVVPLFICISAWYTILPIQWISF